MGTVTWSYSSIKLFDQCPKKYYHLRVAKDIKDSESDAMHYGNEMHKAAELYIKSGTPLPGKFSYLQGTLDALNAIPGKKHCEIKMGITYDGSDYGACGFFDKKVWMRTIADLIIIQDDSAYVVDYKTGKNSKYADTKQLDLVAGAVFTHYPEVTKVKSALAFVVSKELIKKKQDASLRKSYLSTFDPQLERLKAAHDTGVWNANSTPLCAWCPVVSCPHNRSK